VIAITFDPEARALYIYMNDTRMSETVVRTEELVEDTINADYYEDGSLAGIEILIGA